MDYPLQCRRETCAIPGFETSLLSSMLGSSMESACDRKAGERAGITRAAKGIGESGGPFGVWQTNSSKAGERRVA